MTRWTYDPVARVWPRVMWVWSHDLKSWSDPIWGDPWGIDPALFQDPVSRRVYLNLMAPNNNEDRIWGIYQCEVDVDSGHCIGEYRSMWNGTLPHNASARSEGPKMFKRDQWYYLLIAEGKQHLIPESNSRLTIEQVARTTFTVPVSHAPCLQKDPGSLRRIIRFFLMERTVTITSPCNPPAMRPSSRRPTATVTRSTLLDVRSMVRRRWAGRPSCHQSAGRTDGR